MFMMPSFRNLRGFLAVALFLVVASLSFARPASARQLVIQHFDDQVTVNADGTIEVSEVIDAKFTGSWNGIYRTIPVEYTTPQGLNYTLFLEPLSITDDNGHALKYEQSRQGRYTKFKIYVPDANNATRTVILRYRVLDAMRFFDDHDELYWNVTGDEWDVPIESVTAHIELPAGVTGLHAVVYTGAVGSRSGDARVNVNDNVVEIQSTESLNFHEGLTAVVGLDKGFVHPPSQLSSAVMFLRSNWPFFIPIFAFCVMLYLKLTRGREPARGSIAVQYEPPDKLTPGECGTLVDDEAAMRDITATLVDLAVKGYLTIEQKDESKMLGLMHGKSYTFHLKKPPAQWAVLRPHESALLAGMFEVGNPALPDFGLSQPRGLGVLQEVTSAVGGPISSAMGSTLNPPGPENYSEAIGGFALRPTDQSGTPGVSVSLSDLQNHFYTRLPGIREAIFDALMRDGYYLHRPDSVRQGYIGVGFVIGVLLFIGGGYLAGATGMSPFVWTASGILTGIIICAFGWFMPARTITGVRTLEKVLGFEDFLSRTQKDQIDRLEKTPELFEKYLPYAMALQVEKKWAQAFSGIAMQPPSWYQGYYGAGFQPYLLISDLNMMSMQTGSIMASSPRSSGGSGFGGGGMSGGGFGGGGGGGF